ncbi:hypothetical protein DFA_09844 [Cavenderia fasciculata]|uniref:Uncharacterized protein n=1 Tax=Cavenderia fasciculata TaxID=261658 RepID=F4QAW3_CACFS|nr:uncharacterized protein DFA_09844 [Cavenderia fasciculata]EGG15022.1 hypothetical protein DFA_09844 [Cavenderia fasciculata]|eukprot:XP_004351742.1 hypothetical protein DFA_09844 [Cavenderia fasciculata]
MSAMENNDEELNNFFAKKDKTKTKKVTKIISPAAAVAQAPVVSSPAPSTTSPTTTTTSTATPTSLSQSNESTPTTTSPTLQSSSGSVVGVKQPKTLVDLSQTRSKDQSSPTTISEIKEIKNEVPHIPVNMRWAEKSNENTQTSTSTSSSTKSSKQYPSLTLSKDEKPKKESSDDKYIGQDKEQIQDDERTEEQVPAAKSSKKKQQQQQKPKKKTKEDLEIEQLMAQAGLGKKK